MGGIETMTLEGKALLCAGLAIGGIFGLPLYFAPLRWARIFGWWLPDDPRLTRYFGRCVGGLILVLAGFALWAASRVDLQPAALAIATGGATAMIPIHIVGAVEKSQPVSETIEIGVWVGVAAFFGWLWVR
jgi:hypothetical protein